MNARMIIHFTWPDVMQPAPWPIGVDPDNTVTSGLGPDDGARLLGFGIKGDQHIDITVEQAREDPSRAVGLTPSFSNDGGMFEWLCEVDELVLIEVAGGDTRGAATSATT